MGITYTGGFGKRPGYRYSPSSAPHATGGKVQPRSGGPKLAKPKKVTVKAHTRTLKPKAPQAPVSSDQALIDAAVRTHYAPREQALTQALAQNARFASGTGDWYANALNEIKGLRDQGNAAAQQTLGRITAYNSQPTLANANDQQAATARNNLNAEFANQFGRDQQGNSDAMNRLAAAYAIQQGNTMNQTNAQRQQLLGQQEQLGQQKADYGLTYGAQLQQAQTKALTDQTKIDLAAKALGLKVDTLNKVQIPLAQSLQKDRTTKQKVARTNTRIKKQAQSETKHQNAVNNALKVGSQAEKALVDSQKLQQKGKGSNKGGGRYTQTQLNKYDNQWRGALALATHLKSAKTWKDKNDKDSSGNPKVKPVTRDVVYSALLKKFPNDPEFAAAAANLAFGGSIDEHDRHVLSTKGVHPKAPGDLGNAIVKTVLNVPNIIKTLNSVGK